MRVIFDGRCGLCSGLVDAVLKADRGRRIDALPSQVPGLIERYGLSRDQVDHSVWVVTAEGERFEGHHAVNRILMELGGAWRLIGRALECPWMAWIEAHGYRWVADHRAWFGWLGATPACDRPGSACDQRAKSAKPVESGSGGSCKSASRSSARRAR